MDADARTKRELATVARRAREATARRDDLIRELRAQGMTLAEIGKLAGMTHAGIRRVIDRGPRTEPAGDDDAGA